MTAGILLMLSMVLGVTVDQVGKPSVVRADPRVQQLERANQRQADELTKMRQLFTYCQTFRTDDRCDDTGSAARSLLPVTERRTVQSDHSDSSDSSDTTIIVQQPRPASSPSRGSQRPGHTQTETDPDTRPGRTSQGHSDRHRQSGDRSTGNSGK